jgi:hypothetical protein
MRSNIFNVDLKQKLAIKLNSTYRESFKNKEHYERKPYQQDANQN